MIIYEYNVTSNYTENCKTYEESVWVYECDYRRGLCW
jgi:hypothetical protein